MKIDYNILIQQQRDFFNLGFTLDIKFRKEQLYRFKKALIEMEEELLLALQKDFKKSEFEGISTELLQLHTELNKQLKNLKSWAKPERVSSSIINFPSKEYIYKQPYGVILIISPWNYPVLLTLQPLVVAIATGNCAIIKPSELSIHTSAILEKLITSCFDEKYIKVIQGGAEETQLLLEQKFDKIFFTGSGNVGKIVLQAAAQHLTPVVLELGGKSPSVITSTANLDLAAKRIAYGKFLNAGQTCIAPDFVWIHKSVKREFIELIKQNIEKLYGEDIQNNPDFPRIINLKHFLRLQKYIDNHNIAFGGEVDEADLYISPTILDEPEWDSPVMQEEIFGPILPIISFDNLDEVIEHNHQNEKPLALYFFTGDIKEAKENMVKMQFGGGCINDVLVHFVNYNLPFGGFGASGMGHYHGKFGWNSFTHQKAIVQRVNWLDIPFKYPPYANKIKLLLSFFKWIKR